MPLPFVFGTRTHLFFIKSLESNPSRKKREIESEAGCYFSCVASWFSPGEQEFYKLIRRLYNRFLDQLLYYAVFESMFDRVKYMLSTTRKMYWVIPALAAGLIKLNFCFLGLYVAPTSMSAHGHPTDNLDRHALSGDHHGASPSSHRPHSAHKPHSAGEHQGADACCIDMQADPALFASHKPPVPRFSVVLIGGPSHSTPPLFAIRESSSRFQANGPPPGPAYSLQILHQTFLI
jgi:hypothetical protein